MTPPRTTTRSGLKQWNSTSRSASASSWSRYSLDADRAHRRARDGNVGEVRRRRTDRPWSSRICAVLPSAEEAGRVRQRPDRGDPRLAAGRDPVPAIARQADAVELRLHRLGGARRIGDEDDLAPLVTPLRAAARPSPGRAARRRGRRPRCRTGSREYASGPSASQVTLIRGRPSPAPASIGATSSGLLSSRKVNGGVSTSTTSIGMPAARKRNCSRPSSSLQMADRSRYIGVERLRAVGVDADVQPHRRQLAVQRAAGQIGDQLLRKIKRAALVVGDDAGAADPALPLPRPAARGLRTRAGAWRGSPPARRDWRPYDRSAQ